MSHYAAHPLAVVFPLLDGPKLEALAEDIKQNGLVYPIILYEGKILDGRNRYQACLKAKVAPRFETYRGKTPLKHIISLNLKRRHLDESQRAMCAARSVNWQHGGAKTKQDANLHLGQLLTCEQAAKEFSVSIRSIKAAHELMVAVDPKLATREEDRTAKPTAVPELLVAVDTGKVPVSTAVVMAKETTRPTQARILRDLDAGEIKASGIITEIKRTATKAKLSDVAAVRAKAAKGVYDVLVIDPPWPMKKSERTERPNQAAFGYPTMTEEQLVDVKSWYGRETLPCTDNAHVWVWTTHKFLPMALRLLEAWGLRYVCTFVWHKPGGPQLYGLPQFNCEFALYARRGSPEFIDTKNLPACFEAPRSEHSEKPEEFYAMVRRVTAGRRLDIFNRRQIEGFDCWGKEAAA